MQCTRIVLGGRENEALWQIDGFAVQNENGGHASVAPVQTCTADGLVQWLRPALKKTTLRRKIWQIFSGAPNRHFGHSSWPSAKQFVVLSAPRVLPPLIPPPSAAVLPCVYNICSSVASWPINTTNLFPPEALAWRVRQAYHMHLSLVAAISFI